MPPPMASTPAVAPGRLLDLFDDDEDDDAMRRLWASPVLFPNNSKTVHQTASFNSTARLRKAETQPLAPDRHDARISLHPTHELQARVPYSQGAHYDVDHQRVDREHDASRTSASHAASPQNQRVFSNPSAPNTVQQTAKGEEKFNNEDTQERQFDNIDSSATPMPSLSTASSAPMLAASASDALPQATVRPNSLVQHFTKNNLAARGANSSANESQHHPTRQQRDQPFSSRFIARQHPNRTSGTGVSKLEEKIAALEKLLKASVPSTTFSSASPPVCQAPVSLLRSTARTHQEAPRASPVVPGSTETILSEQTVVHATPSLRDYVAATTHRRASSSSSESSKPSARNENAEQEADFGPGEFFLSSDALEVSAAAAAPRIDRTAADLHHVQGRQEANNGDAAESDQTLDDIPHFASSRYELPPNMSVPALTDYSHRAPRMQQPIEPTRAHVPPSVLHHPQPRRGAGTGAPTASTLEADADRRSAQSQAPSAIDLTVEYEDQPVDIAARSVKPHRESTTKVKFAELEDEEDDDDEEAGTAVEKGENQVSPPPPPPSAVMRPFQTNVADVVDPAPLKFEFEETDILKGLSMPSLARRYSESSSETSDSDPQPESPVDYAKPLPEAAVMDKGKGRETDTPLPPPLPLNLKKPIARDTPSKDSSRSSSPSSGSERSSASDADSDSDAVAKRNNPMAAVKVSAPPIRWGGSLNKRDELRRPSQMQRSGQKYGMHSGYSGPTRQFREFRYPSSTPSTSWRGSADADAHNDDEAIEKGNQSLASFKEDYRVPVNAEMSSRARTPPSMEDLMSRITPRKTSMKIIGASQRLEAERRKREEQSELDIFDELLKLN